MNITTLRKVSEYRVIPTRITNADGEFKPDYSVETRTWYGSWQRMASYNTMEDAVKHIEHMTQEKVTLEDTT